jgi:hypothetical protein
MAARRPARCHCIGGPRAVGGPAINPASSNRDVVNKALRSSAELAAIMLLSWTTSRRLESNEKYFRCSVVGASARLALRQSSRSVRDQKAGPSLRMRDAISIINVVSSCSLHFCLNAGGRPSGLSGSSGCTMLDNGVDIGQQQTKNEAFIIHHDAVQMAQVELAVETGCRDFLVGLELSYILDSRVARLEEAFDSIVLDKYLPRRLEQRIFRMLEAQGSPASITQCRPFFQVVKKIVVETNKGRPIRCRLPVNTAWTRLFVDDVEREDEIFREKIVIETLLTSLGSPGGSGASSAKNGSNGAISHSYTSVSNTSPSTTCPDRRASRYAMYFSAMRGESINSEGRMRTYKTLPFRRTLKSLRGRRPICS